MSVWLVVSAVLLIGLVAVWLASFAIEALRPQPELPRTLRWAPEIEVAFADLAGMSIRYIKTGHGPNLVLLHTLRTQLDLFEKVVTSLSAEFTVYAPDYPGHGYSTIPKAQYDAMFFVRSIEGFLDKLDLDNITLCGVSIGASIALILAGRGNARVARVVAINPYDYANGGGIARSGPVGWLTFATARVPVVGETFTRLRTFVLVNSVFRGGVVKRENLPRALAKEMYLAGNRRNYYRGFLSLLRNARSWQDATAIYPSARIPVRLVWGDRDWSRPDERERDRKLLSGATAVTVDRAGHFFPLDRPDAMIQQIRYSASS